MKFFNPSLCVLAALVAFMAAAMNPPTHLYLIIGIVLLAVVLLTTRRVQPATVDKRTNNDLYGNHPGTNPFN
jgi:hypothetical protein